MFTHFLSLNGAQRYEEIIKHSMIWAKNNQIHKNENALLFINSKALKCEKSLLAETIDFRFWMGLNLSGKK